MEGIDETEGTTPADDDITETDQTAGGDEDENGGGEPGLDQEGTEEEDTSTDVG